MSKKLLSVHNLTKIYGAGTTAIKALDSVSLDVFQNEILALLGVNGAGKSTLSSLIATVHPPTSGDILFEGTSIYDNLIHYRSHLGFCPQKPNLDNMLTLEQNLRFAGRFYRMTEEALSARLNELVQQFELEKYLACKASVLSGGYRQRFMIARCLMHNPKIVLLDEPTVGLDPHIRRQLWAIIKGLKENGVTVILTTHYLDEAEQLADRVCIIDAGRIKLIDTPKNLLADFKQKNLEDVFLALLQENPGGSMNTNITHYFQPDLFWQLLCSKSTNMYKTLFDKFINFYIWAACSLLVAGYLLQAFGLSKDFGPFQLGSILAGVGIFELYGNAVTIVSDIEGDRTIAYYLTLPTSAFTVLASFVCYYALIGISMGILLLPLAKAILGTQFVLANVSWLSLIFFIILINGFFATATLMLSALIPSMDKFDILWTRFIFPLWFLGGFQFSWLSIYAKSPWLSYAMLANPIIYTTEGVRAALLGQEGCLPLWLCSIVLLVLWIFIGFGAYKTLKKRLDFV